MRRVIAIEKPDGSLLAFESGKPITFTRVGDASPWVSPGERLIPIEVPDEHEDALVAHPTN
jgi:hypothetical protein